MVIWINGPFGGGKSTTAGELTSRQSDLRLFDPEIVGYMLQAQLRGVESDDFQDLPAWRRLVPAVMAEVAGHTGQRLVAVQTVLSEPYWDELMAGCSALGVGVTHVLLDCAAEVLEARIDGDEVESGAREWRHDHVAPFVAARTWLHDRADVVIDTSAKSPGDAAEALIARLELAG